MKDGAILGHDPVDEMQVACDSTQLTENPPGDEQVDDALRTGRGYRLPNHQAVIAEDLGDPA